ncbi:NAD(P)-binding domain-containing protein [Micrococcus antarcticus]|uniref:NADPH-dependent F420 reductase n=1 Tax=Micrococcus antarcticus TaxID=86171 RepID=UPI00384CA5F6
MSPTSVDPALPRFPHLPSTVGILGAGRAGTALARALARIPRLHPWIAAPDVVMAATRRPAAVQRHLGIYAPEAVAVAPEDLAQAELTVVAVPREALDDVDPAWFAGPATRAVVDMTNTWEAEPLPDWMDPHDGDPRLGTERLAARWAAAGLTAPLVRAFSEISHHDLGVAGRTEAPRWALAIGTERHTDGGGHALPGGRERLRARDTVIDLVHAMGFDGVVYQGFEEGVRLEPGGPAFGSGGDLEELSRRMSSSPEWPDARPDAWPRE